MLGFIILLIFLCGSTQKSAPSDVIHIVEVNRPFVWEEWPWPGGTKNTLANNAVESWSERILVFEWCFKLFVFLPHCILCHPVCCFCVCPMWPFHANQGSIKNPTFLKHFIYLSFLHFSESRILSPLRQREGLLWRARINKLGKFLTSAILKST